MVSGDLQSVDGEQHPCPRCGPFRKWEPDDLEADLVKRTDLSSYVWLKSKLERTAGEKVFDDSRARWRGYSAANLATLHGIGAARYFLDHIRELKPTPGVDAVLQIPQLVGQAQLALFRWRL